MTRSQLRRACVAVLVAVPLALSAAACGNQAGPGQQGSSDQAVGAQASGTYGSHLSRVKLYSSVASLAKDSPLIVSGRVTAQKVVKDIDPITDFTLSTVTIDTVVKGPAGLAPGATVVVRQMGSQAPEQNPDVPLFNTETSYLLYLNPSGLSGELASQYYVVGAEAGIYTLPVAAVNARSTGAFARGVPDSDDKLPATLTLEGALG